MTKTKAVPTKHHKTNNLDVSHDSFINICSLLEKQFNKEEREAKYAPVKQILAILGRGAIISGAFLAPKSATLLAKLVDDSPDYNAWKHYNPCYLKRTLRRLEQQKQVEVVKVKDQEIIRLTRQGQQKILRLNLDRLHNQQPKKWDGKWRLILYDVPVQEKSLSEIFRQALQTIGCYQIQRSVYLYPYACFNEIEFLRESYGLGDKVQYMVIESIERDSAFKTYFNLE